MNLRRQMEDFRAGQICAVIVNCTAPRKGKPFSPADFFSSLKAEQPQQTPEQMIAMAQMITAMQNARNSAITQ